MALVPEQGSGKLTAILLFVIALIFLYLLLFHWFILRHVEFSEEIAGLSEQLGRFERVAAQRGRYETLLYELQDRSADLSLFVRGEDFNEAEGVMSAELARHGNLLQEAQVFDAFLPYLDL